MQNGAMEIPRLFLWLGPEFFTQHPHTFPILL